MLISFQKAVLPLCAYNRNRSDSCGFKPQRQRMLPVRVTGPRSWEGDDVVVVAWKLRIAWEMKKGSVLRLSSSSQAQCQAPAFVQTTFLSSVNKSCKKIDIVKYTLQVFLLGNLQIKSSSSISTEAVLWHFWEAWHWGRTGGQAESLPVPQIMTWSLCRARSVNAGAYQWSTERKAGACACSHGTEEGNSLELKKVPNVEISTFKAKTAKRRKSWGAQKESWGRDES